MSFCNCTAVSWRGFHEIMPNTQMPTTKELRAQLDRRIQAFWTVSGERSTARQCRGYGPCPSRTAAADADTDSKLQHPFPLEYKIPPHNLHAAVETAPVSLRGFGFIMPITQRLPQRNDIRVQPDRRRQPMWPMPRARSAAK